MDLILRQGRIVDPAQNLDQVGDLGILKGRIVAISGNIPPKGKREIDCTGLVVAPGFLDMHVHLREPGREDAETIETGTKAAARGGFTAVACMPNTRPVNDSDEVTAFILKRAREVSPIPVYPIGAITLGSRGETLADIERMVHAGIVAISDDGQPVQNSQIMRRAMEIARSLDIPVIDHCEDRDLAAGGCMNEGLQAALLGVNGINPAAEEVQVERDAILARRTGARVHIAHLSSRHSLETVRRARAEGIAISCEVTPHHLLLTEESVSACGANAKMNPPLRTRQDVEALAAGLAAGIIDGIATDHAPHTGPDKRRGIDKAPFGIVGLETAVGLIMDRLVRPGILSLAGMVAAFSLNPARILKLERGTLALGRSADITILDPDLRWEVRAESFLSKGRNTPFEGWKLCGGPALTIVQGNVIWSR
jgi:dihydroorotase